MVGTSRFWIGLGLFAATGLIAGAAFGLLRDTSGGEPDLPIQAVEAYEIFSDTVEDLAAQADLVFVGEIVRYDQAVYEFPAEEEDPDKSTMIADGIVFRPLEVIRGEAADEVVVTTLVELRDAEGVATSRLVEPTAEVVAKAVDNIGKEEATTFLIFASELQAAPGFYGFQGTGGVVEVLADGHFVSAAAPPFTERADGKASALDMTLDEVIKAIISVP